MFWVQNLTLSQFASWLKRHPVPILKLTLNLIDWFMVQLLPIYSMFSGLFVYEILGLFALRLENSDGIQLIIAWEITKYMLNWVLRVGSSKRHPVPILEAQKIHPVRKLVAQKSHLFQRHIPSTPKYGSTPPAPPPGDLIWFWTIS